MVDLDTASGCHSEADHHTVAAAAGCRMAAAHRACSRSSASLTAAGRMVGHTAGCKVGRLT